MQIRNANDRASVGAASSEHLDRSPDEPREAMGLVLGLTRPTLCWSAHDDDARLKESWKEPRRGDDENRYVP